MTITAMEKDFDTLCYSTQGTENSGWLDQVWALLEDSLVWLFVAATIYRLYLCLQPPITSTDLLRYIGFGKEFWKYGLTIYNYPTQHFVGTPYAQDWPTMHFIYPALAMLFFALVSKIWPALFLGKLVLTAIEGLNAFLIWKISDDRLLALLYYINPASLWWFSREGQYEPLLVLFGLMALYLLSRRPQWAYLNLALAIQTKYTPGFLLPYFLRRKMGWRQGLFFIVGFVPSILFTLRSEYIFRIFTPGYMPTNCNSYTWNIFDAEKLCGTPFWLVVANALLTYGMLILCLGFAVRRVLPVPSAVEGSPSATPRMHPSKGSVLSLSKGSVLSLSKGSVLSLLKDSRVFEYLGLALVIVFLKSITWAQFWYIPTIPLFALTIEEPRERRLFFSLCLFEMAAIHNLLIAPFGWVDPTPPYQYMWGL
jgi:hypothetical protein